MAASPVPVLSPAIARRWLARAGSVGHLRLEGSLLYADISGFTRLSERLARRGRAGAEEVVRLVNGVMTGIVAEMELRGGDILVFAGDALVVLFEGDGAALQAVRGAAMIRNWFSTRGAIATSAGRVVLRVSIGVASGSIDLVLAGRDEMGLFVAGPTTSETVRLERAAGPGELLVCDRTAEALPAAWLGARRGDGRLVSRTIPLGASVTLSTPEPEPNEARLVPRAVRPLLDAGPVAIESDHRLATIAFALAGGLDAAFEARPDGVAADLHELYAMAADAAGRHGVTLLGPDTTLDGVALFLAAGAPVATENDEERMLLALREILDAPIARRLRLRAGVSRGPVFAGVVGAPHRATYTAMGDTTNLAARVAGRARPGELLATADVLARSATEFATEPAAAFLPKGKRAVVVPYAVGPARARTIRTQASLRLAGRETELELLRSRLADATHGQGSTVVIRGEPGVGKSRLLAELLAHASGQHRLEIRFASGDEATPYLGVRSALRELAGIDDADSGSDEAAARLRSWAISHVPSIEPDLPLVGIPFGVAFPETPEVAGMAPAFRRQRLHAAVVSLLRAALPPGSVIVVEDLHWSDEASSALLEEVAREAGAGAWLVTALTRPFAEPFDAPGATVIELAGLAPDDLAAVAIEAAGDTPLSDADLAAIVERAAGIPLFARELATLVVERGSAEGLPDRLESLLASRIDRLDARLRALLRRAAVLGRTVDLSLLGELLAGEPVVRDLAAWTALDEFVGWVDEGRVRFRHDLYRDAAYEGLAVETRRELHGRLASVLEARPDADLDELAATLAHHFVRAGDHARAFVYGRRGGDVARGRYANVDAAALYRRALQAGAAAGTVPQDELCLVAECLGDVSELAGQYEQALSAYAQARRLARRSRALGPIASGRLARKTGVVCERGGRYREALAWYSRARGALGDARSEDAESLTSRLALDQAGIRFRQGRYADCVRLALPVSRRAREAGDRSLEAQAYYLLNAGYSEMGSPEAIRYRDLALPIYEEIGDLVGQGNALNNLGVEAYFEGRWDDALDLYARSKAAKARAGDVANAATQSNNEAEILSDQGHFAEAEALLRDALRVWGAARYEIGIALATSNLGRAAARAGRHDEGMATLEAAAARFERMGAAGYVDETRARIAECLVLAGRAADAAAVARDTLARVRREAETSVLEAQLERTLGWCALLDGDPRAAHAHLDRSVAVAGELGADFERALTLRARRLLPDLDPDERSRAAAEADRVLSALGVVVVAEPLVPSTAAAGPTEPVA